MISFIILVLVIVFTLTDFNFIAMSFSIVSIVYTIIGIFIKNLKRLFDISIPKIKTSLNEVENV